MKPSELKAFIKSRIESKIKRSVLVESSPGIGKTQIAAQIASELGIGFKTIHAPLLQPEDYGFPVINADKTDVNFLVSLDKFPMEDSKCEDAGILLIDEMSQADSSAQKILANLIQEREIHGKKLKKGWSIVATGNRVSDRSGANRILGHLSNRLTRIELEASLEDWTSWALNSGVKPEVISFIRFRPSMLSSYDAQKEINATPRAWAEGVSMGIGSIPEGLEYDAFRGDVGDGPASEFLAFLKIYRELPDVQTIFSSPDTTPVPSDLSTIYAVIGSIVGSMTLKDFPAALKYVRRMPTEFSLLFIRDARSKIPSVQTTKEFIHWATNEGKELF